MNKITVDTGYYSRKETMEISLEGLPHLRLSDHRGKPLIAIAALAVRPSPFEPWHLPRFGDCVFFLLERKGRMPKLLGPHPKQGISASSLLGDPDNFTLRSNDGAFCLYEDESVNVMVPPLEAARLREWLPGAIVNGIARAGARSRVWAVA